MWTPPPSVEGNKCLAHRLIEKAKKKKKKTTSAHTRLSGQFWDIWVVVLLARVIGNHEFFSLFVRSLFAACQHRIPPRSPSLSHTLSHAQLNASHAASHFVRGINPAALDSCSKHCYEALGCGAVFWRSSASEAGRFEKLGSGGAGEGNGQ